MRRQPVERLRILEADALDDLRDTGSEAIADKTAIAARCRPGDPLGFEKHDDPAAPLQFPGRGYPGKPAADDTDIASIDAAQRGCDLTGRRRRLIPGLRRLHAHKSPESLLLSAILDDSGRSLPRYIAAVALCLFHKLLRPQPFEDHRCVSRPAGSSGTGRIRP